MADPVTGLRQENTPIKTSEEGQSHLMTNHAYI